MAKIKQANKEGVVAVFEDPRPSSTTMYLYGDAYNKSTLAPIYDGHLTTKTNTGAWDGLGYTNNTDNIASAGVPGMSMATSKPCTSVIYSTQTGDEVRNNVNIHWAGSMNEDYPANPVQYFTDGTSNMVTWLSFTQGYSHHWGVIWSNPSDNELHEVSPQGYYAGGGSGYNTWYNVPYHVIYKDPNSDGISGIYARSAPGQHIYQSNRPYHGVMKMNSFPVYSSYSYAYHKDLYITQFIGPSDVDGQALYLFNYVSNDYTQIVSRHNISANNETVLHTFNGTPAASGSNYGGARDIASGMRQQAKISSKVFDDPTSVGNECWYTPYFDTSNNFFPFFYQWDKTTDTFTRNEDVTITGDLSSSHLGNLSSTRNGNAAGLSAVIYNETFEFSGSRYLCVMPIASAYQVNDAADEARTIVVYSIDAANPKALTHHSAVVVPATIKNIVWLNDARTSLGVFNHESFHVYNFDATNGFVKTATFPYQFWSVGRDSTDRVFATSYNSTGHVDIHMITTDAPTSIVITPASSTYDYQGSTINSTVGVSAYNSAGDRIAVTVDLTIDGSTMTFGDDTTTASVTTSTSADVDQAIKIIGAGFSDIIARVQI